MSKFRVFAKHAWKWILSLLVGVGAFLVLLSHRRKSKIPLGVIEEPDLTKEAKMAQERINTKTEEVWERVQLEKQDTEPYTTFNELLGKRRGPEA